MIQRREPAREGVFDHNLERIVENRLASRGEAQRTAVDRPEAGLETLGAADGLEAPALEADEAQGGEVDSTGRAVRVRPDGWRQYYSAAASLFSSSAMKPPDWRVHRSA